MTIFDVLKAENAKTLTLLRKLEDSAGGRPEERAQLLRQVCVQIESTNRAEDQVFYPLLAGDEYARAEVETSRQNDQAIQRLLRQLADMPGTDPGFQQAAETLRGQVRRHVVHEEQRLFPIAARRIPRDQIEDLSPRLQQRRTELAEKLRARA